MRLSIRWFNWFKARFSLTNMDIFSTADLDPDLQKKWTQDLMKKLTLNQNSLYELKTPFWQIGGCCFHISQLVFKILAPKYPIKASLVPSLGIFVFSENFEIRQIRGCWFQIWQYCFQIPAKNTQIQNFLWKLKSFFFLSETFSEINFA